jgi:hypothetical protein
MVLAMDRIELLLSLLGLILAVGAIYLAVRPKKVLKYAVVARQRFTVSPAARAKACIWP